MVEHWLTHLFSVKAILDANRNSLMLLELRFSIFTLGLGAGTFVAALYGMNLKNFLEESDIGFTGISAWCTVFGICVCVWGLTKLRRVQRVSMWGDHGVKKTRRKRWRDWGDRQELRGPGGAERERVAVRAREGLGQVIARDKALQRRAAVLEGGVGDAVPR